MSSLWFNIRFGVKHLQIGRDGISIIENPSQVHWKKTQPWNWKWFAIYTWFGKSLY